MSIIEVSKKNHRELQSIADSIAAAKKIVVFTGAGISTNCGIPVRPLLINLSQSLANASQDFRSEEGLYALMQAQHETARSSKGASLRSTYSKKPTEVTLPTNTKGKDLFDSMIWRDPVSTSVFYRFIASLRKTIYEDVRRATSTHRFIRTLRERRKLVRCYTQNIDGLEEKEGMSIDLDRGKGSRSRFTKKALEKPHGAIRPSPGRSIEAGCEVVQLHGDLESLRCTLCQRSCAWDDLSHTPQLLAGRSPRCAFCAANDQARQDRGKRGTKVGTLRPNIVLYGEEHPSADVIGAITANDLTMSPDFLLILGTSLHVHGLKTLVREFAKAVHARPGGKGKVVFINLSRPAESVWKDVIDYWVCMDCDEWVAKTKKCRPDICQVQEELRLTVRKPSKQKPQIKSGFFEEDDKENIISDSQESTPSSSPRPRVVVTVSKEPKSPLAEKNSELAIPFKIPTSNSTSIEIPDSDPQSSLPTPPSTGGGLSPMRKRKQLAEVCNATFHVTPSKRQRLRMDIWEDQ